MTNATIPAKGYCNCLALQNGLDPVGYAGSFDDAIILEVPLPWKSDMMMQAGSLPQEVIDLLARWLQAYQATGQYRHRPLVIAPDEGYSREGYRRVMFYTRPAGLFSQFEKVEYLVPVADVGPLVWALYEDRAGLPRFDSYRVAEADRVRDMLVCTHGTIDAACARFGYPLYRHLRDHYANEHLRVWRVSHFGGHVFAPTLMDMPAGHFWAYVETDQAAQIVRRTGDVAALRGCYRGWAGLDDGFQQTAECALWQQHGWAWFDYPKSGRMLAQASGDDPQWADVRLRWSAPAGGEVFAEMRVEVSHQIETPHSSDSDAVYAYPQYRVAETGQTLSAVHLQTRMKSR